MLAVAGAVSLMLLAIAVYRVVAPVPRPTNWSGALLGGPEIAFRPRPSPDGYLVAFFAVCLLYTSFRFPARVSSAAGFNFCPMMAVNF